MTTALCIVVPVKQVPQVATLRFDPERRRPVREGVPLVLNAYDRRALGEALRLRRAAGGSVTVLTMGPPAARRALEECVALGADRAIHLCDPALAGGDALATARTLAAAIRPLAPDLILCGQRSVDAETSQVGPALAELLDLPQVTAAARVTPSEDARALHVERLTDVGRELLRVPLPCLLTAAERLHRPEAGEPPPVPGGAQIETRTAADLGLSPESIGQAGSATWVRELRQVAVTRRRQMLEGPTDRVVGRLGEMIANPTPWPPPRVGEVAGGKGVFPDILIFAERLHDGTLAPATLRLLPLARRLTACLGGRSIALLAGRPGLADQAGELAAAGADAVLLAEASALATYSTEPYAWLLAEATRALRPAAVLLAATASGRDLAPRVAARLGLGLVSECEDVRVEPDGRLTFIRPSLGGSVLADVEVGTRMALATVRARGPHARPLPASGRGVCSPPRVGCTAFDLTSLPPSRTTLLRSHADVGLAGLALDVAEVVVGVGSGIGGPERLAEIRRLADALGGAIGATRKVVDLGWLPPQQQIGLSGRQIAPRRYLAVGVRGSFNHAVGIRRSETVIAINKDPKAEIFGECDLGVVADWREIVPPLIERLAASP